MADRFKGWLKPDFVREINRLEKLIKQRNPRGAGRKPKLTRELQSEIVYMSRSGIGYREIAKKCGISLGLVCKACNMTPAEIEKLTP
jgi:DNA invertase Pin-like site-specific DNA recombinase